MLSLPNRLKKDKDLEAVFKKGRPFFAKFFTVKAIPNNLEVSRFGFAVSTKISKSAVKRNRVRRQLREAVRALLLEIKPGFDVVVMGKSELLDKDLKTITSALGWSFEKMNLLKR